MELLSGVKRTASTYFSNHDPGVASVPLTGLGSEPALISARSGPSPH